MVCGKPMESRDTRSGDGPETRYGLSAEDLWQLETWFGGGGGSEFVYDGELDVFRFPEDGRFAFCREFADWRRLRERGYLDF